VKGDEGTREGTKDAYARARPTPSLRVGVLLGDDVQPRWLLHALRYIEDSSVAHIVTVMITEPQRRPGAIGARPESSHLLYRLLLAADRRLFRRQPDPYAKVSIAAVVTEAQWLRLPDATPLDGGVWTRIRDADLDVILCVGPCELGTRLISAARHGVWYFPDLAPEPGIACPVGFNATVHTEPVVETSLNQLTAEGTPGPVLYRAVSAVNRLSPHYTERRVLWKMATFPSRALEALAHTTSPPEDLRPSESPVVVSPVGPATMPSPARMLGIVGRLGSRQVAHAVRSALYRPEWTVAYRRDAVLSWETLTRPRQAGIYTEINSPPDRFWADPFPVFDGNTHWLFVEEFPHAAERAHLSVMEFYPDGGVGPSIPILSRAYHLSYPFVFHWAGDWYMVPETHENQAIDLFRSPRFPFDWTFARRLVDGVRAVDATLAEIDGRWWMFTTIAPYGGSENDELHIYLADSPLGPWAPHPGNPQWSDVRCSRPAGRIFALDGVWYRPAQDCSRRYGYAVTINRITVLSDTGYAEEEVARIDPSWARGLLGTHTFNHSHGITMVDDARWRPRVACRFRW